MNQLSRIKKLQSKAPRVVSYLLQDGSVVTMRSDGQLTAFCDAMHGRRTHAANILLSAKAIDSAESGKLHVLCQAVVGCGPYGKVDARTTPSETFDPKGMTIR